MKIYPQARTIIAIHDNIIQETGGLGGISAVGVFARMCHRGRLPSFSGHSSVLKNPKRPLKVVALDLVGLLPIGRKRQPNHR